jgi:hypothetical protein
MFFQGRLADLTSLSHLREELASCQKLNVAMQKHLHAWCAISTKRNPAVMLDQASLPWFAELNRSLQDSFDDVAFRSKLRESARCLRTLATQILQRGQAEYPGLDASALMAALEGTGGPLPGEVDMLFASADLLAA